MSAAKSDTEDQKQPSKELEWVEVPIFIHGISPEKYPTTGEDEYNELFKRIKANLAKYPDKKFTGDPIFVTWGTPTGSQSAGSNQYLAEVERKIQAKVKERMGDAYGKLLGIARDLIFFGVSDLFYYLSEDGEADLRKHVFSTIANSIKRMDKNKNECFSLTIFGHSAGSVISHDLLYHLFSGKDHESEVGKMEDAMDTLRAMVKQDRLRIRHLYTFGSPISALVLRATSLLKRFIEKPNETFNPQNIGLLLGDNLPLPRWVNFWSRYDLASYPVDFLYANDKGIIEDHEISTSMNPKNAHTGYWTSDEMAEHIAKTF